MVTMNIRSFFLWPTALIAAICVAVFLLVPTATLILSYSGDQVLAGQIWRLITFPFVHTGINHLVNNLIVLAMTAWLAYEVELEPKQMIAAFIGTSILLALTTLFFIPTLIIAGASVGIFGLLGSTGAKGTRFVPQPTLILVLGASVFIRYLVEIATEGFFIQSSTLMQTLMHSAGFIYGLLLFISLWRYREIIKQKRILQTSTQDD
jgi:membrane associated rhomboid family serine protease